MIVAIFVALWALSMVTLPALINLACSEPEAEPSQLLRPTVYAWVREQPRWVVPIGASSL
ncbi:hypothetical protein [Nocardia sp. NPDC059228]|uniref:hypothetical protein n=1 Tax=Nocardia sp. NPDC059228 TaxID=3346777 RepID=UPI0036A8EB61